MNDQDERFYFSSLLSLMATASSAVQAAEQIVALLERIFACRCEIWLSPLEAQRGLRCVHPQGNFSRFEWSANPDVLQPHQDDFQRWPGGRYWVSLGPSGYLLAESDPAWSPVVERQVTRCGQLAVGALQTLLDQERLQLRVAQLEKRQHHLETESAWLNRCLTLMQTGSDLLDPKRVLEKLTPLILEAFPGDGLVLGIKTEDGWQIEEQMGSPWPAEGNWRDLWTTSYTYAQVVHFADLRETRFAQAVPGAVSLTVAPLGFNTGVLCRYATQPRQELDQSLRNFEIGALLLGHLLKISELHDQVREAYEALQDSEMQRSQAVKLAAIAQIAAGVAHEVNNPLASIQLTLEMANRDRGLSPSSQKALGSALQAVKRCREVTTELLSFSRQSQKDYRETIDLQEIGRRALGISQEWAVSRNMTLEAELESQPLWVEANPGQVQEILLHVIENALWASEQAGRGAVVLRGQGQGEWAELLILDEGPGIEENLTQKIFEPFFTTRPMGEATGLGLAISRRMAQSFGGDLILLESGPDGSTFCLRLPRKQR